MVEKKRDDCSTGSCPVVGDSKSKLVPSNELPLHGNPYPPKDVIQSDAPSSLELAVRSVRTTMQPFTAPFCSAYRRTSDIISIGVAHTQSAVANLSSNRGSLSKIAVISGSGLLGVLVARRRGIFRRLMVGSISAGAAALACYPRETRDKAELAFFIAKNRLPALVQEQYQKVTGAKSTSASPNQSDVKATQSDGKKQGD